MQTQSKSKPKDGPYKELFKDGSVSCKRVGEWKTYSAEGKLVKTSRHKSKA